MDYGNEDFVLVDMEYLNFLTEFDYSFSTFSLLLEIFKGTDCGNKAYITSYSYIAQRFRKTPEIIKKSIFKLRDNGFIEIYKSNIPKFVSIVMRKNEFLGFYGKNIYFDEDKILKTPKSKARNDKGYSKFRKTVLERDNYICQLCGSKEKLEVHHKKSYSNYERLRTTVSNGITLCEKCHGKVHSGEMVL